MLVGAKPVHGIRRQCVFDQVPAPPDVHDRDDRPVGAVLDRDRARVASLAIDEVLERHDPFVAKPVGPVDVDRSCEVALLRPELGGVCELRSRYGTTSSASSARRSGRIPKCFSAMCCARTRAL
jgi:hypothetical protein